VTVSVLAVPLGVGFGGAGDFGEGLGEFCGAGDTDLGVVPIAQIDDFLARAELQCAGATLDQLEEPRRVGETVVAQRDRRALGAGLKLLDAGLATRAFDRDDLEQVFDFERQCAEAVNQFRGEAVDLAAVGEPGNTAVEPEPHAGDRQPPREHQGLRLEIVICVAVPLSLPTGHKYS
jgi:hypothetical protein